MPKVDGVGNVAGSELVRKTTVLPGNSIDKAGKKDNSLPDDITQEILDSSNDTSVSTTPNIIPETIKLDPQVDRKLTEFKDMAETLHALEQVSGLAEWDLETYMPSTASDTRAMQVKVVNTLSHKLLTSKKMENLLSYLSSEEIIIQLSDIDKMMVKKYKEDFEEAKKIPSRFVQEFSEITTKGYSIWEEAKETKDFSKFIPCLEKIVALMRQQAEYKGYKGSPYNALLDDYEEGMTTEELDKVFNALKKELVPVIHAIADSGVDIKSDFLRKGFSHAKQMELSKELLEHIGFDLTIGRVDETVHPFCSGLGLNDTRIGTNIPKRDLWSTIGSAIHEGGHGLYAQGIAPEIANTRLGDSPSMGIDESQSRLYETQVGMGLPFWIHYLPKLKEKFPKQLEGVEVEDFWKAINIVKPNLIRINSDEVTYQMHVIIRYEIERDLIEGKLEVKDIPKAWNQKMHEYLGIKPKNDGEGAFQDVHWSCGMFGYFPTYTLGNLYAAQIFNTARKEIPDLDITIAEGKVKVLTDWLREKIHKHGDMKTTKEIIKEVTGEDLNPQHFVDYVKTKYSKIYPGIK